MPLTTQSKLGHYEVVALLGAGAMGEVYRARDTRLRRDVALKIIDTTKVDDDDRGLRFEQEARSASALNHPNVVTIHDVGHEDRLAYIVTELVDGDPLRKYLQQGSLLPMRQVLDFGIQIAEGLAAAHDHGIVHRDLKPENIMITRDGRVKILDFGLAKPFTEEGAADSFDTAPGVLFGTTAYMSPEQAKGVRVSYYSDQFSLGVILHEMVSGSHPFKRDAPLATLSAILTEAPPELNRGSPPLQWLITRCLHREPDHRYASTHDLVRELRNIADRLTDTSATPATDIADAPRRRISWRRPLLWIGALALIGTAAYFFLNTSPRHTDLWQKARFLPLATEDGLEVFPAWSPDGHRMAYAGEIDGVFQIQVKSTGASTPVQLTRSESDCFFPFWSPDEARIYYISAQSLWSVGATGGTPETVLPNVVQAAISPTGNSLAVLRAENGSFRIWTGSVTGKDFKRYDRAPFDELKILPSSYLRFSPDGKQIGAWLSLINGRSEFWTIPTPGNKPEHRLPGVDRFALARPFTWLPDSRGVVYTAPPEGSIQSHLWRARFGMENPSRISNGPAIESSPSLSLKDNRLAFTSVQSGYKLIRVQFAGKMEGMSAPSSGHSPVLSAQGDLAYVTDASGLPEIWLRQSSGRWQRPIVTSSSFSSPTLSIDDPAFSSDGRRLAYGRVGEQDESIWISIVTGESAVRLTRAEEDTFQRGPSWSPDGNSIAYFSVRKGSYVLMRARVGSVDPPELIAANAGTYPRWSPKGDTIASLGQQHGLILISPEGQRRKEVGSGRWLAHGWSEDGSQLYGVRTTEKGRLEFVSLRAADGNETVLSDMGRIPPAYSYALATGEPPLRGFSLSADKKGFLTSEIRARSDIWILDPRN